jgi:phosphohistidine phosphatase
MQLVLFRHGIAEAREANVPDADRALTKKGLKRTKAAAAGLTTLIDPPEAILTSPKVRAYQTAELAGEALAQDVTQWDLLAEADAEELAHALKQRAEASLVLVGHEPTFSELIELLCYGRRHGQTELKKAGCAILDAPFTHGDRATLQALLPPRVLRTLAETT